MSAHNFAAKIRLSAVPALLLLSAQAAAAGDPITISATVPYANNEVGTIAIREQCDWNSELPARLVARSNGGIIASDKPLSTETGRSLKMVVTSVHAAGGMFGGPKWAIVHGELFDNGKLQGNFAMRRVTSAGRITSCGALDKVATALAADITEWLKNPTIHTETSAETKTP